MSTQRITTIAHRMQADDSELATVGYVRSEFATLDRHLTSQFDSQYQFQKDVAAGFRSSLEDISQRLLNTVKETNTRFDQTFGRFDEINGRLEEINGRFEETNTKIDRTNTRLDETNRRFDEILLLGRNRLASRAHEHIWRLPTAEGTTPPFFPRTIAMFWKLKEPSYRPQLASLLQSYGYNDFETWGEYDDWGERIERTQLQTYPSNTSSLEHFINLYPGKAHLTLADILGLEYNNVRREMEALQKYIAKPATRNKRENDTEVGIRLGRSSKQARATISENSSLTEEIHRGEVGDYKQTHLSSTPDRSLKSASKFSAPDTSSEEN